MELKCFAVVLVLLSARLAYGGMSSGDGSILNECAPGKLLHAVATYYACNSHYVIFCRNG